MADQKILLYFLLSSVPVLLVYAAKPQSGKFSVTKNATEKSPNNLEFTKILNNNTKIILIVTFNGCDKDDKENPQDIGYNIEWILRYTDCSDVYLYLNKEDLSNLWIEGYCTILLAEEQYHTIKTLTSEGNETVTCDQPLSLEDRSKEHMVTCISEIPSKDGENGETTNEEASQAPAKGAENKEGKKNSRAINKRDAKSVSTAKTEITTTKSPGNNDKNVVATAWEAGPYLLSVRLYPNKKAKKLGLSLTVDVEFKHGTRGYLSAHDWPMLVFYGVMCGVYCVFAFAWLLCSACVWKDLLRIQFWIGGVIFLGLVEKAAFYSEYHHVFVEGFDTGGVVIFAEVISALKRSLARMLVVIVSVGFGIVKPRLGSTLHKVLAAGALYFVLASIEGSMRATHELNDTNHNILIAGIPLAVLDAVFCYWIFSSLFQTIRTLRLRRNVVKLSLYRHFTNTLIFAVVAAIIFIAWSIKTLKTTSCLTDWQELWVDDAYWHLLFCVILMVIMILWRPTANNQRYAFSPLQDLLEGDEENEETENTQPPEAFDTMKLRNVGKSNGEMRRHQTSAEDDLKWIEENIPSSVAEAALPTLLDSDEEIMTTRTELNKME